MQLRKEVPLELVVNMFRKLVSSLLLPIELFSRPAFLFVELAAHHVLAGRRTDWDDHQNGHRSLVDSSLSPSRRSLRGEGHS